MAVEVKICGLSQPEDITALIKAQADYAGFIFFEKSPRHLSYEKAAALAAPMPDSIKKIAVLVNPDDAALAQAIEAIDPAFIQLHGDESPERIAAIKAACGLPIIKALPIGTKQDLAAVKIYENIADRFLFDAKPTRSDSYGGTGQTFDWSLLSDFTPPAKMGAWFLSGGLTAENVAQAIATTRAQAVDVSSGVEAALGRKDSAKIAQFIFAARPNP